MMAQIIFVFALESGAQPRLFAGAPLAIIDSLTVGPQTTKRLRA
jgi:hypothetical protein